MLVLVTGARGAIGRHVVAGAKRRDAVVIGLGHGEWAGEAGLPAIDRWVNGDVTLDNLDILVGDGAAPDLAVHLAGGSHVGSSLERPAEDFRRTVIGAHNLVEWLRTRSPKTRLVIASSAAVYGNTAILPISEDATCAPASPYGTHKAMVEMLARAYARQYGLKAVIVRLFSVYGPALRKQLVFELFKLMRTGERVITLGGTGEEVRDFLFIEDAAEMLLIASRQASPDIPVFNGAAGAAVRVAGLASAVAKHFEDVTISFSGSVRKGDPQSLVGDISQARRAGLLAPTSLEAGLARTLDWIECDMGSQ